MKFPLTFHIGMAIVNWIIWNACWFRKTVFHSCQVSGKGFDSVDQNNIDHTHTHSHTERCENIENKLTTYTTNTLAKLTLMDKMVTFFAMHKRGWKVSTLSKISHVSNQCTCVRVLTFVCILYGQNDSAGRGGGDEHIKCCGFNVVFTVNQINISLVWIILL